MSIQSSRYKAPFWKKLIQFCVFVLLFSASLLTINDSEIFELPSSHHAWASYDYLSIAQGFQDNGFDFFHPRTHNLHPPYSHDEFLEDPQGITRVDFPIQPYVAALLDEVWPGPLPFWYRIVSFLFFLSGAFYFFKLLREKLQSAWVAMPLTLCLLLTPLVAFYAIGFIPSVSALSMFLIGLYFKFTGERTWKYTLFFTLAALIRTPFVVFLIAALIMETIEFIRKRGNKTTVIGLSIGLLTVIGYGFYNIHLGLKYGSLFLDHFMPAESVRDTLSIVGRTISNWWADLFSIPQWIVVGSIIITGFVQSKKNWKFISWWNISAFGILIYSFLMLRQFEHHDYYLIDTLLPLLLVGIMHCIVGLRAIPKWPSFILFGIIWLTTVYISMDRVFEKVYATPLDRTFWTERSFKLARYHFRNMNMDEDLKPMVLDSYSANIPLYLLDLDGYVLFDTSPDKLEAAIQNTPYDYLIVQDNTMISDVFRNYPELYKTHYRFGGDGEISLYARGTNNHTREEFLGLDLFQKKKTFEWKQQQEVDEYCLNTIGNIPGSGRVHFYLNSRTRDIGKDVYWNVVFDYPNGSSMIYRSFNLRDHAAMMEKGEFEFQCNIRQRGIEVKTYLYNPSGIRINIDEARTTYYFDRKKEEKPLPDFD